MTSSDRYRRLFVYNDWANRHLWELILRLTDEQYQQPSSYSIGSVHNQIVHLMEAEALMLRRVIRAPHQPLTPPQNFPDRNAVRARWDDISAGWRVYLDPLTDSDLDQVIEYTSVVTGKQHRVPVWEILSHCINHSTDHRSQTLAQMHHVGAETAALDFLFFTWEHPSL